MFLTLIGNTCTDVLADLSYNSISLIGVQEYILCLVTGKPTTDS
jgi:hypothetical protein